MSRLLWNYTIGELDTRLQMAHKEEVRFHLNIIINWLKEELKAEEAYQVSREIQQIKTKEERPVYREAYSGKNDAERLDRLALDSCPIIELEPLQNAGLFDLERELK